MQNRKKIYLVIGLVVVSFVGGLFADSVSTESVKQEKIIGGTAFISFPDFDLNKVKVKVDTGAQTSSLHCSDIVLSKDSKFVEFYLLDKTHPKYKNEKITLPVERITRVKSSNGEAQDRIFVMIKAKYQDHEQLTEFSLSDRSRMRYPALIGCSFLRKNYIVDVNKKAK